MSIGIYGDSFASWDTTTEFAWYNLLAKKLNTDVYSYELRTRATYGFPATSTFYSYKKFMEYNDLHEYNIFVASAASKYTKFVDLFMHKPPVPLPGINSLEWHLGDPNLRPDAPEILDRIRSWLIVSDDEFMHTAQELILQDMERNTVDSDGHLIILSSDIDETFCQHRKENSCADFGLWGLCELMYKEMGVTKENRHHVLNEKSDKISCHMSDITNEVLADLLYKHIMTGEKMTLPERIPHNHTWEYYYN